MVALKLGHKMNDIPVALNIHTVFNAHHSLQVKSNFQDVSFLKAKGFLRFIETWETFQITLGAEYGLIQPLLGSKSLPMNDAFFLKNFKGLSNLGY
mmetsp:Transcript_7098/g.11962  ORF Transcript_7098/g.11962 Transcript_7098/m.11962 type:complete len:96 (-) Transcript_7098:384-671(-)